MEKFGRTLHSRLVLSGLYCIGVLLLIVLGVFRPGDQHVSDYISGFSLGMCAGIEAVVLFYMIKYIAALRDETKLKKLYIEEHDERMKMIRNMSGRSGIVFSIAGLLLGAMVAGYFSDTVFFTLIGAVVFISLIVLSMKIYYCRKYSE